MTPINLLARLGAAALALAATVLSLIPRAFPSFFSRRQSPRIRAGRRPLNPRDTAARFAREFEEDYGQHSLPFFDGGYATAYDLAKKELKFLLVILLSPEHDDNSIFVREILLSSEFTSFLQGQSDVILWAGNVQDSEAYQISTALNCSKFPFAAFVAHAPQVSSTAMSTIARVSGLMSPASFVSQLRGAIEQHAPQLSRVRGRRNEQQASRTLRDEQNSAYERSLAQDRERARQRREAEAAQATAAEAARLQAESQSRRRQQAEQWRKWRASSIQEEPTSEDKNASRISIRLPSGERLIRKFRSTSKIDEVYAFVDCKEFVSPGAPEMTSKPDDYMHEYEFRLVSPMPRVVYDPATDEEVSSAFGRSANLLVEALNEPDEDE